MVEDLRYSFRISYQEDGYRDSFYVTGLRYDNPNYLLGYENDILVFMIPHSRVVTVKRLKKEKDEENETLD